MTPALHLLTALSQSYYPSTLNGLLSFPPNPPNSKQTIFPKHRDRPLRITISRRDVVSLSFLSLVPFLSPVAPASAFSIGICTSVSFAFHKISLSLSLVTEALVSWLVHSRTQGLAKRAKEEGVQIPFGPNWCLTRKPSLCTSLARYENSLFLNLWFWNLLFSVVQISWFLHSGRGLWIHR